MIQQYHDYLTDYGLISCNKVEKNPENSPLWTMQNILMSNDNFLFCSMDAFIDECHIEKGLYNQNPDLPNTHDRYMSKDQLIAFASYLYKDGQKDKLKKIWSWLKWHFLTYNNLSGRTDFARFMGEGGIFVGVLCGHFYLKPILRAYIASACNDPREETSGKLKAFTMMMTLEWQDLIMRYNDEIGGWHDVFDIYFRHDPEHPNTKLAKIIYK